MKYVTYVLVLLADWGNGLLALLAAGYLTGTQIEWWYALIAIPLAMLPDLDAVPEILRNKRVGASAENPEDHREYFHIPLVYLAIGGGLAWFWGFWGLVFLFAITLHFVNDFYGTGWGIPLLAPFSKRRYKFLGRRVNRLKCQLMADGDWDKLSESERRLRWLVTWEKRELPYYISNWGDENWMEKWYQNINWVSGIEFTIFITAFGIFIVAVL